MRCQGQRRSDQEPVSFGDCRPELVRQGLALRSVFKLRLWAVQPKSLCPSLWPWQGGPETRLRSPLSGWWPSGRASVCLSAKGSRLLRPLPSVVHIHTAGPPCELGRPVGAPQSQGLCPRRRQEGGGVTCTKALVFFVQSRLLPVPVPTRGAWGASAVGAVLGTHGAEEPGCQQQPHPRS